MISRAAVVPLQHDAGELRIHNNEVLRKSSVAQQSAIHSCEGRGGVDEIREAANVAIRKKRIRRGKTTQCHGSSQDPAVHHGGADNTRRRCWGQALAPVTLSSLSNLPKSGASPAGRGPQFRVRLNASRITFSKIIGSFASVARTTF